jgi:hypothetical protein
LHELFPFHNAIVVDVNFPKESDRALNELKLFPLLVMQFVQDHLDKFFQSEASVWICLPQLLHSPDPIEIQSVHYFGRVDALFD